MVHNLLVAIDPVQQCWRNISKEITALAKKVKMLTTPHKETKEDDNNFQSLPAPCTYTQASFFMLPSLL